MWSLCRKRFWFASQASMFRAFGIVIVLYALSHFFNQAFLKLDDAAAAVFTTAEVAAKVAAEKINR